MLSTRQNFPSLSPSRDRHSGSRSFEFRENTPPPVDRSRNIPKLPLGSEGKVWPSGSFGGIHKIYCRKMTPRTSSRQPVASNLDSEEQREICQSVRDAFIPPRHHFVNNKNRRVDSGRTEKTTIAPFGIIFELGQNDIVCGRGAPSNLQEGNKMFREMVEEHQAFYLCSKRADKPKIAIQVMEEVRARGARFVRRVKTATNGRSFGWEELEAKQSYEKVCQALREGAPEIRRKILSCSKIRNDKQQNDQKSPERPVSLFQGRGYSCHYY